MKDKKSILSIFRPRLPLSWIGQAASSTRETASAIRGALTVEPTPAAIIELTPRERWQRMLVEDLPFAQMTPEAMERFLRRQYKHRFHYFPWLALMVAAGGATTLFADQLGGGWPAQTLLFQLAGFALSLTGSLYWLQNALVAHQIRHRELVTLREWWQRLRNNPSEAIIKPLPRDWQLDYPEPPEPEVEEEYWEEEDY